MIGKTISHYKILEKLGAGGMGVVYKAQDTKLDRFVALKFLPKQLSQAEEEKKRFIHEAKAASALNHPNIATIYEIDEVDGQMFIAMEYIEGYSLAEIVGDAHVRPLPIEDAIDYAIQIAEGLANAHAKGIVHRDIKPANILVTEDGLVKIVDFGLAKLAGRTILTKEGTTLGTVAYMSPEQTQGSKVDHRTDIWALGVMMYEMMTGQPPFKGDYEQAVIYSILNEDPEPITSLESLDGKDFLKLIQKALQKNQNERYQTIEDLKTDLRPLRKELGANKTENLKNDRRSIRKFPLLHYGITAVIITVTAVIFSFFLTRRDLIDSIAVLPIQNVSGDPAQEYFSDGMTDALIGHLGSIKALRVISRTSVMQYKNTTKSVKDIAQELNVSHVVEGSVLRVKDRVRISTQLIDAEKDQQIWGHSYERELTDILMMQSEVATAIANEIKVTMTPSEQQRLTSHKPIEPEAYNAYLQGRFYWNKRTGNGLRRGIEHFEQAIAIDPNFAEAYAGLADCYNIIGLYGSVSPKESVPKGKAAAFRAVEIDESLAEAHTSLALAHFIFDHDWLTAEKEFIRAIELNPNYPTAHHWYALYLAAMRRPHEAMTEMKKAQELDPLSLIINAETGWMLYFARDYDQAIEQCKKALMLDPSFAVTHWILGLAYTQKPMYERAINAFQEAVNASGRATYTLASLGYAYAVSGQKSEAQKILDEVGEASNKYISPMDMAFIYTGLGMKDQAFGWLHRAYEDRSSNFPIYLSVGPRLDELRRDPRFVALLDKMGLQHSGRFQAKSRN